MKETCQMIKDSLESQKKLKEEEKKEIDLNITEKD